MIKNLIKYYYNLTVSETRKIDNYYIFYVNDIEYEFLPCYENINNIYNNYLCALRSNRYVHEIVFNKNNVIITFYNQVPYILLKKNNNSNSIISFKNIIHYDCRVNVEFALNWKKLWKEKIDYYEYQINQLGGKYSIVKECFNYYLGLSELAISIINYVDYKEIKPYLSHKRINIYDTESIFCNPLNLLIDTRVRDIAEYIKINIINNKISNEESLNEINSMNLNRSESLLLLSRLIYPTQFFDMYDKIIQGKLGEVKLNTLIQKNVYYETFLRDVYKNLNLKYNFPEIDWLLF